MAQLLPMTLKSSKLLSILYIYARGLQALDDELARTKDDQNIATCRAEYIQSIWGEKLGQVFTSDFTIDRYRALLLELVKISLTDSVKQNIEDTVHAYFPTAIVEIHEYWQDPSLLIGYNWQNTSFLFRGVGQTQIPGNSWNDTRPWVMNLHVLGFILFGVQIHLRNLVAADVPQIESYVIPALETFVRPAGVYYKTIVLDIDMIPLSRIKDASTRDIPVADSIIGFGLQPFGSPTPVLPNDWGFGSPTLP